MWVLLAVITVRKISIRVDFQGLRVYNIGLSVAWWVRSFIYCNRGP
jgi:hypothetical protein